MEASIICNVGGNDQDNVLNVKEADIGKDILVIVDQTSRDYCRVLLYGTETYIPKSCIKLKPFPSFYGEITNTEAEEILSSDEEKLAIISLRQRILNFIISLKVKGGQIKHFIIKRKIDRFKVQGNEYFPSINRLLENAILVASKEDLHSNQNGPHRPMNVVCTLPAPWPLPRGQLSWDNTLRLRDYETLIPGEYLSSVLINWALLNMQQNNPNKRVLLLCTQLSDIELNKWQPESGLAAISKEWLSRIGEGRLWQEGGCKVVVHPLFWQNHFYTLVAWLSKVEPRVYMLESIGGQPWAEPPPVVEKFVHLLDLLRKRESTSGPPIEVRVPEVPRQSDGNSCGIYTLRYIQEIYSNYKNFIERAKKNNLQNWFDPSDLGHLGRRDLAKIIADLAKNQRGPGGVLNHDDNLELPLQEPSVLKEQVKRIRSLCSFSIL